MIDSSRISPYSTMNEDIIHRGGCYCKAVTYEVQGKPTLSAYCHCTLCQRLNAAAFILTCHFSASQFHWTHTTESMENTLDSYAVASKPWKVRWRCKQCGCTIASNNTKVNSWSVWGAQLDRDIQGNIIGWETIKPTSHIFYDTRMVDVADELSKWTGYEGKSQRIE